VERILVHHYSISSEARHDIAPCVVDDLLSMDIWLDLSLAQSTLSATAHSRSAALNGAPLISFCTLRNLASDMMARCHATGDDERTNAGVDGTIQYIVVRYVIRALTGSDVYECRWKWWEQEGRVNAIDATCTLLDGRSGIGSDHGMVVSAQHRRLYILIEIASLIRIVYLQMVAWA
jgi:hypothetical protein